MTAATPGQAARERLASAVHDLFGADCPNEPCPQCARREAELMDLADDYAGAGLPDSPLAADNTRLRKEGDLLRSQLQAVRRLMADAAANGMIDSRAILDLIAAAPAAPQPAPELAEPVTVAGVPYSDYPSLVAAMQAEIDRERTTRLHLAGGRDEARSDYSRLRAVILEGGQSDAAVRKRCLGIIQTAGTPPLDAPLDAQRKHRPGACQCTPCRAAAPELGTAWRLLDEAREQVRLARQDRDQLRKAVLDLAATWGDLAVRCDEAAALDGLPKASVLEQATFAHQLRECAAALRKTAEPPA